MVATVISATQNAEALDRYLTAMPAHDANSERFDFVSTVGNCTPETFVADMRDTRIAEGKTGLRVETYHSILSFSHEEADPTNAFHGWLCHQVACEYAKAAFPGHQAKIVTSRDNGRWELDPNGEKVWLPGKWHCHLQIANVAEAAAEVRWRGADGVEHVRKYQAGRAIDGFLKDRTRLKTITNEVVRRELGYDNWAFMRARREHAVKQRREQLTAAELAARSEQIAAADEAELARIKAADDQVDSLVEDMRRRLHPVLSTSTDWEQFTTRAVTEAEIEVRASGKNGCAYIDVATGQRVRARKMGPQFNRTRVTEQLARNAEAVAEGAELAPTKLPRWTPPKGMPAPVYLDEDGKPARPVWEREALANGYEELVARLEATGTVEGFVRESLDRARADKRAAAGFEGLVQAAADHGLGLDDTSDGLVVYARVGPAQGFGCRVTELGAQYRGLDELAREHHAEALASARMDDLMDRLNAEPAPDFDLEDEQEPETEPETFVAQVVSEPEERFVAQVVSEPEPEPVKAAQAPAVAPVVGHDEVEDEGVSSRRRRRRVAEQEKAAEAPQPEPSAVERLREADRVPVPPWSGLTKQFVKWLDKGPQGERFRSWFDRLGATAPRWDDRPDRLADDDPMAPMHYLTDVEGRFLSLYDARSGGKASQAYAKHAHQAYKAHRRMVTQGVTDARLKTPAEYWSERVGTGGLVIPKGNAPKAQQRNRQYGS
ncbi:relaxase/mobilization nuclease domain-containing protein [Gordonia paraffinivorans]|uniref:relaxase/mobilization nuclease domain-containing protein n=1 Tax=Gordonia paraffinivorans TaxID=175628 RepID=UPI001E2CACFC|nr:hypothetical protein [Gordonia paraffinivorans]MCD2143720.1 hypothetical protein [Gordonia paraffinivorans]